MTPSGRLAAQDARRQFAALVARPDEEIDLAHAALLVGAEEEPRCDTARCLALLEQMGGEARARIALQHFAPAAALNQYLFEEQGFTGNRNEYYDPRNSLLHYVLEHRTGIPLTLSVVYMEVGRRAGLQMEGIGLPGHFIVRARSSNPEEPFGNILVDPFHGKIIDEDECQQRLDVIYDGQVALTPEHLRPATTREILVRLLRNLKAIYVQAHLYRRALAVIERVLLLASGAVDERRDRGMVLAQLDRLPEAISEIQSYLQFAPGHEDVETTREQLKRLQIRLATLN